MHAKHILAAFATIPLAQAAVWNITVGGSAGIVFTPSQVTAAVGDTLHFVFGPPSHSVTQSTFAAPCTPMAGGFNSGLMATQLQSGGPTYDVMVNSTDPIWVYCEQVGHCQGGMVFAANPTTAQSFTAFQAAAMGKSSNANTGSSSSAAAAAASTTGSTSSGAYGSSSNDASALELKGWMVGAAAFIGAAAMI
ncbi:hypothetical protein FRC04_005078 [Tulasnella sp. 424]|nr:hypothetical protein FRC04_005078 [Tulasnella sp. 424]KAG8963223.1 hypothetical protein FRC05_004903 [Tulasnella sp. 425]